MTWLEMASDRSGNAGSAAAEADKYRQLLLGGSDKLPGRKGGKDWGAAAAADGTDSDEVRSDETTDLVNLSLRRAAWPRSRS